jgi:hypothetical protein
VGTPHRTELQRQVLPAKGPQCKPPLVFPGYPGTWGGKTLKTTCRKQVSGASAGEVDLCAVHPLSNRPPELRSPWGTGSEPGPPSLQARRKTSLC